MQIKQILAAIVLLVTACSPQAAPPTIVLPTATLTEISATRTPLPPTATLPPTWTPAPTVTPEVVNTENSQQAQDVTPVSGSDTGVIQSIRSTITPLAVCDTFGEDTTRNQRNFTVGAPVQVAWTAVSGATLYRIQLFNSEGAELKLEFVPETSYTFTADLFSSSVVYGWQVTPLDPYSVQMCAAFGMELFPNS